MRLQEEVMRPKLPIVPRRLLFVRVRAGFGRQRAELLHISLTAACALSILNLY